MINLAYYRDSLKNFVSKLGTERDKASGAIYDTPAMDRAALLAAYRGSWLPRKIVDIPALDACREWRDWKAKENDARDLWKEELKLQLPVKTFHASVAARLFGGSALYMSIKNQTNPAMPINLERVGKGDLQRYTLLMDSQLKPGPIEERLDNEFFGKPSFYSFKKADGTELRIHPSRLVIFHGNPLPGNDQGQLQQDAIAGSYAATKTDGWGDSVLLSVMEAIKHADGTSANVASLVYEAKVDIVRVPNLMQGMADERFEQLLLNRFTLAAIAKGNNGTLLLDKEEEYEQKNMSFATLPDIMDRFFLSVSGAADIPVTRLFGQSPAGLSSTGESDLRNYYDRIRSNQELFLGPEMATADEVLIRSATGARADEIYYEWSPLWQASDKEKAETGKIKAETVKTIQDSKLFEPEVVSRTAANLFTEGEVLPGLEEALDEFGDEPPEPDPQEALAAAGMTVMKPRAVPIGTPPEPKV